MKKYMRKAVVVEAEQFMPNVFPWPKGVNDTTGHWSNRKKSGKKFFGFTDNKGYAATINPGDWVVTNQIGERYIVQPDVFFTVYEEIKENIN